MFAVLIFSFSKITGMPQLLRIRTYFDAVQCVARKPGNRFCQDKIDFLFPAQLHHLVKLFPLSGAYAGDAVVRENPGKLPIIMMGNFVGIIIHLHLEAVLLFFFLRAHPAVGRHTEFLLLFSEIP